MSRATPLVALSFRQFLVKILKPENDGVLELVKNVSCNPNTVDLYLLESRASSSKLAWKLRKFHWIMEYSIVSVRRDGWRVIGQGRKLVRKNQILLCLLQSVWSYRLGWYLGPSGRSGAPGVWNPSTSTRTPSTFTLVGEHLEDDESSFVVEIFKGPAEPLGFGGSCRTLRCHFLGIGGTPRGRFGGSAEPLSSLKNT